MKLNELKDLIAGKPAGVSLKKLIPLFPEKTIFTTSFGIEDQVITHLIFANELPVEVVTLDTGRLFPETYKVFAETTGKYKKKIKVYFPDYYAVEKMVDSKGPFSFYESRENREECCTIRKVNSLKRALLGKKLWISGIRAEQSDNRSGMEMLQFDTDRNLFRFLPLFDWSYTDVMKFIEDNNIPYNSLHDQGYLSIGCEPCTRPVKPGQDFRAGRWWWETDGPKECGCHVRQGKESAGIPDILKNSVY